jgi:hypothetical protein
MNTTIQDNINTAEILLLKAHELALNEHNHKSLFSDKKAVELLAQKMFSIECALSFLNPNLVAPNDANKFERNEVGVQVAKYRACDCPDHMRIGQTAKWCCNTCGNVDEKAEAESPTKASKQ